VDVIDDIKFNDHKIWYNREYLKVDKESTMMLSKVMIMQSR